MHIYTHIYIHIHTYIPTDKYIYMNSTLYTYIQVISA